MNVYSQIDLFMGIAEVRNIYSYWHLDTSHLIGKVRLKNKQKSCHIGSCQDNIFIVLVFRELIFVLYGRLYIAFFC